MWVSPRGLEDFLREKRQGWHSHSSNSVGPRLGGRMRRGQEGAGGRCGGL